MTDTRTSAQRSAIMRSVSQKNTAPEMKVRRLLFGMGYRYRLHERKLPGTPDIVFPGKKKVIFVHGCFWHQHFNCPKGRAPKSRLSYWGPKLERNKARDIENITLLRKSGWGVMVVWQCELDDLSSLADKLVGFLRAKE